MHRWQHTIIMLAASIILMGKAASSQEDTAKLDALHQELAQAKVALQTAQAQHAQELAALKAAHEKALEEVQQKLSTANASLEARKGENAQWQAKHAEAAQALATAQARSQTLQQTVEQLQAESAQWQAKHAAAADEATTAQTRLTQLTQEVETQQGELTQARAQHQAAAQQIATLEAKLTGLEAEAAARTAEVTTLQQRVAQAQTESTQWQAKHAEAAQLLATTQTRLQTLQSAMDRIQEARSQAEARQQQAAAHLQRLSEQATKLLQNTMQPDNLLVEQQSDRLLVRMGANAAYWSGTASLKPASQQALQALAGFLREFPDHGVRIVGHTDAQPISEKYRELWPTNWELSTARAAAVARYLERHDVAPQRLSIIGFAFHWPLASNDTPEGRRQNRRVEIAIVPPVPQ